MKKYSQIMRRMSIGIAVLAFILLLICALYRVRIGNTVVAVITNPGLPANTSFEDLPDELIMEMETEGVVSADQARIHEDYIELRFRAVAPGSTGCSIRMEGDEDSAYCYLRVDRWMNIFCNHSYFTGLEMYILAAGIFYLGVAILCIVTFVRMKDSVLYSYVSIFLTGLAIFFGVGGVSALFEFIRYLIDPYYYGIPVLLDSLWAIPNNCMLYMTLPMLLFAVAMIISNIELLRHERPRLSNVLGLLIPLLMIGGEVFCVLFATRDFSGSFNDYRRRLLLDNVFITIYVYFEYMLAASVICGIRAAKHRVSPDRDFIVILGCRFRKDGTLTPLLKGRCDRAIEFRNEQLEKTGKDAILIPSGGQGSDEPMPEAHAMRNYLIEAGVPDDRIICEDKSVNTFQNMQFSKRIIKERKPDAKTAFSTTNYHIFRSGVWAGLAGLEAEGIGSSTKWWFWPNAFMRECVGLFVNRIRQELVLLAAIVLMDAWMLYLIVR